jgi:hypothetical protein
MARGLSDLQKFILSFALENQRQGKNFLRNQEILIERWKWPHAVEDSIRGTVGKAEYNNAHASLSRALRRLWWRGLLDIWKNVAGSAIGITLTDTGEEVAWRIMVSPE